MPNELDPVVDQWYAHRDKGQRFYDLDQHVERHLQAERILSSRVVDEILDDDERTVEIQHFDGDIEELSREEWRSLRIELSEEPENWSGALDIAEQDDLGTGVTDTNADDWTEPGEDYRRPNK